MIIEWPLNGPFHDAVTDVLTSRTNVFEVVDVDDDDDWPFVAMKCQFFLVKTSVSNVLK